MGEHIFEVPAGGTKGHQGLGWKVEADGIHGIQRQNGDRFHRVLQYKHDDSGKYGCWYLMVGGGAQLQSRQSSTILPGLEHMPNKALCMCSRFNGQFCTLRP